MQGVYEWCGWRAALVSAWTAIWTVIDSVQRPDLLGRRGYQGRLLASRTLFPTD